MIDDEPEFQIQRKLRAAAGETGTVDIAAIHEQKKDKYFLYQGYHDKTCLVEIDEEPPHDMNSEALSIVLQVSKMINAHIVDQIQIMRKTVVDGSNTSGFQRTSLVARDGHVTLGKKKIRIPTICVEEDAARIMHTDTDFTVYRLDRLGIPLIEMATHADITSPEECRNVAEYLGMLLRSTGRVKRGLGTIRQDVNVSIKGGARAEIKGAQDLRQIKTLVEYEVIRQNTLLSMMRTLRKAKHHPKIENISSIFKTSNCAILKNKNVMGFRAEGTHGYLGREIQPGKRLGTELSEYAKMSGVKGIFHSDEKLENYGISAEEIQKVRSMLDCSKNDSFILVAAPQKQAELALTNVINRIALLPDKIPLEVRRANDDGTSAFLRPMPGGSRMYPETDIAPIIPNVSNIIIPKLLTEQKEDLKKEFSLSDDLAGLILKKGILFAEIVAKYDNIEPSFLANYYVNTEKEIKRRFNIEVDIEKYADEILERLNNKEIPKDAVIEILVDLEKGRKINWVAFKLDEGTLEQEIKDIIDEFPKLDIKPLMGEVMKKLKGRVSGKKVMEILQKLK